MHVVHKPTQMLMNFDELVIDNFAGGGGASTGIEKAIGRPVDIAINHDPEALAMHAANHPHTLHLCESVWDVDPRELCGNRTVGLVWLSPDCKHHSKAKGGKPVEKGIRGLAWVAVRWAATVSPRIITLENVEEFKKWGPLVKDADGRMRPCKKREGREFNAFCNALRRQGYVVEFRELRACDYGAPTIRKRLFLVARRDGDPIVWPGPTHGDPNSDAVKRGDMLPWRTAAECIDFSLPCPSIFERKRPLADATCRRIAKGIMRYVVNSADPFVVPLTHQGSDRIEGLDQPFKTVTAAHRGERALITPVITEHANASTPRCMSPDEPLRTQCAQVKGGHFALLAPVISRQFGQSVGSGADKPVGTVMPDGLGKTAIVSAFLAKHYGDNGQRPGSEICEPVSTVTAQDHNSLVTSNLVKLRGTNVGQDNRSPLATISAGGTHHAEVRAFLIKYFGTDQNPKLDDPMHTVTARDRFGLVTVHGEEYAIVDIGMRMLQPRELFRAQGFPDDYIIGDDAEQGLKLTKSAQVRMCGNSVCPDVADAIVSANYCSEKSAVSVSA